MEIARTIGLFLAAKRHTAFCWSYHDCNTIVVELHDIIHGTDYLTELTGRYNSKPTALRFTKTVMNAQNWFERAGYCESTQAKTGDILSNGFSAWIVLDDWAYTIREHGTLTREPINSLQAKIWRRPKWEQ